MLKKVISILCVMTMVMQLMVGITFAGNKKINYQGKLSDTNGAPINSTKNTTFRLYNVATGGTALWEETHSVVYSSGTFNVTLGDTTSLDGLAFNQQYYLGIQVTGSNEMTPRQALNSSAYAMGSLGDFNTYGSIDVYGGILGLWNTDTSGGATDTAGIRTWNTIRFYSTCLNNGFYNDANNYGIQLNPRDGSAIFKGSVKIYGIQIGGHSDTNKSNEFIATDGNALRFLKTGAGAALPTYHGSLYVSSGYGGTAPANGAYIQGNVGIGTTDPQAKLQIRNSDDGSDIYSGLRFYPATSATTGSSSYHVISGFRKSGLWITGSTNGGTYGLSTILLKDEGISFATSDGTINPETNVKMIIKNNGNVGIGTTNPISKFFVTDGNGNCGFGYYPGQFGVSNGVDSSIVLQGVGSGQARIRTDVPGRWLSLADGAGTTDVLTVRGGNVGIGTTSPTVTLTVNGNAWCAGVWQSSDVRWKKDILPLKNCLDKVMKLQGVSYLWNTEKYPERNFTKDKQIGLIAQDTEKILPEVVTTDKDGYKGISYDKIVAVLIESTKELKKENDELKKRIDILEKTIVKK
jgi:hypothetical protein